MMDEKKWQLAKSILVIGVVHYTMERTGWSEDEALRRFYDSQVYEDLQNESTKSWYFSAYQLAKFFEDELEGGTLWKDTY